MIDVKEVVKVLGENKIKSISVFDLSDANEKKFVILSTASKATDSKKVADVLAEKFDYKGKIEGYSKGEWIVFDFDGVTTHIFLPKVREKYNLDKLYKPRKVDLKN